MKSNWIVHKIVVLITLILLIACNNKSDKNYSSSRVVNNMPSDIYVDINRLQQDLSDFVTHFRNSNFKSNTISWKDGSESFPFLYKQSDQQVPLLFAERSGLPKGTLVNYFHQVYYYLDQVWIDKKYNSQPYPKDVLALIGDFLNGKFNLNKGDKIGTLLGVRTYSSILRLIEEIDDPRDLPAELTSKFGNIPLDRIKSILTKSAYDAVRIRFYELQSFDTKGYYPVFECRKYWGIAPIMKFDERYKADVPRLESIAKQVHLFLDNPEQSLVGHLKDHLLCVEAIEEAVGRVVDPSTGHGIFDRYVKYIANNLWDYPFYGKQCGPFRGVMGKFTKLKDGSTNYCRENYKSVSDNLYLTYLLKRFGVRENLSLDISALLKDGYNMRIITESETKLDKQLLISK